MDYLDDMVVRLAKEVLLTDKNSAEALAKDMGIDTIKQLCEQQKVDEILNIFIACAEVDLTDQQKNEAREIIELCCG